VKKKTFEKYKTFLIKILPLGKNPEWWSGHGHIPFGHGHFTKNGKIPFFT